MQTECCLRLIHHLFSFCIILTLLVQNRNRFCFPNGLTLFFSILCIQLSVYLSVYFWCGRDWKSSLSSPSFYSYCEYDDTPISTYISLFFCFFASRHYNNMGLKRRRKTQTNFAFRITVVRCRWKLQVKKLHLLILSFKCFDFFLRTWQWVWR